MPQKLLLSLSQRTSSRKNRITVFMVLFLTIFYGTIQAQTGGALNFTNGDYVELASSFNGFNFGISDFTLETWFRTSMTNGTIMSKRSVCNVSAFWNLRISNGKIRFEMMEAGGANTVDVSTPLSYNDNQWHHVAIVRDGIIVQIIMDGYLIVNNGYATITNLNNLTDPIKLGQSACSNFIGELDETRIWTVARTVCEIYDSKNYQFNSTSSTLKFNAHYNQGTVGGNNAAITTLTNSASNAIAATLNTFALSGSTSNWVSSSCPAQGFSATPITTTTVSACGSYTWAGTTYTTSGTYQKTFGVSVGCDSIAQLNLTINDLPSYAVVTGSNSLCTGKNTTLTVSNSIGLSYCTPTTTGNTSSSDYISLFQLSGISKTSGDGPGVYTFYSTEFANVTAGSNYSYSIAIGGPNPVGTAIWIDCNQDGDFNDAGEYIVSSPSSIFGPFGNLTIPTSAYTGHTRMRVACRRNAAPASNQSCGGFDFGEFEDYNIIISGGTVAANTYSWSPSTFLSSTSGPVVTASNMTSSTTYTITGTDANGCTSTVTKSIAVNPLPAAPVISSSSNFICGGTTMNLYHAPAYCTPTVSGSNISGQHYIALFTLGSNLITNPSNDGPGVYNHYTSQTANLQLGTGYTFNIVPGGTIATSKAIWLDINNDGDFSDNGEFITAFPASSSAASGSFVVPPTAYNGLTRMRVAVSSGATISSGQSCSGFIFGEYEDYDVQLSGGDDVFTWAPAAPLNSSVGSPVQIVNQTATTTYTLTITDANGCTNTDTQPISFLPAPNITITASADSVCSGGAVTLTASGASTYSWTNAVSNGVAFIPSATTTYTVTGTAANGCTKTASKQVKVLSNLTAPVISGSSSICSGDSVLLSTVSYCTPTTNPNTIFSIGYSISKFVLGSPIINNFISTIYINNEINLNSVYSNFTNQVVNVTADSQYSIVVYPQGNQAVYTVAFIDFDQDGIFNLTNEVVLANQTPSSSLVATNFTIPSSAKNGVTRLRVLTSSHDFGPDVACFIYDPNNLNTQAYGEYEDYSINITGGVPSNITWSPANAMLNTQGASAIALVNSTTTYTATVTSSNNCIAASTKTVSALAKPNVTISSSSATSCNGSPITLTASGANQYVWSNGVVNGVAFNPSSTTTYSVVGTNNLGCRDTAFVTIPVETGYTIPNFTSSAGCFGQASTFDLSSLYCIPTLGQNIPLVNYISGFNLNSNAIQNTSLKASNQYTYYKNLVATVSAGSSVPFSLSIGGRASNFAGIWIDYNQDGDFSDNGEYVWGIASSSNTFAGNISIPSTASNGITRMRVHCSSSFSSSLQTQSCSDSGDGEYEDYNINIIGGLNTFVWSPANKLTQTVGSKITTLPLNATSTFTVTATSPNGCTYTTTKTITPANPVASVIASSSVSSSCPGDSVLLQAVATSPQPTILVDSLSTTMQAEYSATSNVFNIVATDALTITGFKALISSGSDALLWYKVGGYGNAVVTNSSGWIPLGSYIPITPQGLNSFSTITLTDTLLIPAGQTYGFMISTNGTAHFSPAPGIGFIAASNADLSITSGFSGSYFNLTFGPSIWNGQVIYKKTSPVSSYAWSPSSGMNHPLSSTTSAQVNAATNYVVTVTDANGCTAASSISVGLKPTPTVTISPSNVSICSGTAATLNASGAITYVWHPGNFFSPFITQSPTANTIYTVTGTGSNGCKSTATASVTVTPCSSNLSLKLFIEGFYTGSQTMQTVKMNQGIGSSATDVDVITVELHNAITPYASIASTTANLKTDGTAIASFSNVPNGNYYVVIKYRNTIETWSATPVNIATNSTYDFSNAASKAFGSNQVAMGNGVWAFYSGDLNQDGAIDAFDYFVLDPDVVQGSSGYLSTDLNGDGSIDEFDYLTIDDNITNGISVSAP